MPTGQTSLIWSKDSKTGDLVAYHPDLSLHNGQLEAQGRIRRQEDGSYKCVVRCVDGIRERIEPEIWFAQSWADVQWRRNR